MTTWEVPLVRVEDRVFLPGVPVELAVTPKSRRALELALAGEAPGGEAREGAPRVATVLTFQDGIAPIATVSRVEASTADRVRLRPESRVRIHFVRGDVAAVETYEDHARDVSAEELDRVRAVLLARASGGLRVPGGVVEEVALTQDAERLAYLVLGYTGAPTGRLQRALELLDATARLALCR